MRGAPVRLSRPRDSAERYRPCSVSYARGGPATRRALLGVTLTELMRYAAAGCPERVKHVLYDARAHVFRKDMREASYAWLDRWRRAAR
jgi:hypothetical protein